MKDENSSNAAPAEKPAASASKAQPSKEKDFATRVSRKIDKNTLEVEFGSDAKEGKSFKIYDAGVFHGEGEYNGEEKMAVALTRYLPSQKVHDFAVVF